MDPKATLRDADQAISDGRYDIAEYLLLAYADWRQMKGFEPVEVAGTLLRGDAFAAECRRRLDDATSHGLTQAFGAEFTALNDEDKCNICADFMEAARDEDCDAKEYQRRIGKNNLRSYADCLRAGKRRK